MGGNAFGTPGSRMTTSQHTALVIYAQTHLRNFFPDGIDSPRYLLDKTSHGDVDLLCAVPNHVFTSFKGCFGGGVGLEEKGWWVELVKALRGTRWKRNGPMMSVALPCSVIGSVHDPAAFYQLDLILAPNPTLPFANLSLGYGLNPVLLALPLRTLSRTFIIHLTHVTLKHSPFFGLPAIEITLTDDPVAFCHWLGLDYQGWKETISENEKQVWEWLVDVDEGSLIGTAWRKLGKSKAQITDRMTKKGKGDSPVNRFTEYLRSSTKFASPPTDTEGQVDVGPSTPNADSTPPVPALSPSTTLSSASDNPSMLDPSCPNLLDARAKDALDYRGKKGKYEEMLEERRGKAEGIWKGQVGRVGRRRAVEIEKAVD